MSTSLQFGDIVTWTVSNGVERQGIFLDVVPAGEEPRLPPSCGANRQGFRRGTRPEDSALIRTTGPGWKVFAPRLVNVSRVNPIQAVAA